VSLSDPRDRKTESFSVSEAMVPRDRLGGYPEIGIRAAL
jgi:hypothetical protein